MARKRIEMLYIVIVVVRNCNNLQFNHLLQLAMRKKNKRIKKYKRLRSRGRSKQKFNAFPHLEKSEKAKSRRKLKVSIKVGLKELTRLININFRYI